MGLVLSRIGSQANAYYWHRFCSEASRTETARSVARPPWTVSWANMPTCVYDYVRVSSSKVEIFLRVVPLCTSLPSYRVASDCCAGPALTAAAKRVMLWTQ